MSTAVAPQTLSVSRHALLRACEMGLSQDDLYRIWNGATAAIDDASDDPDDLTWWNPLVPEFLLKTRPHRDTGLPLATTVCYHLPDREWVRLDGRCLTSDGVHMADRGILGPAPVWQFEIRSELPLVISERIAELLPKVRLTSRQMAWSWDHRRFWMPSRPTKVAHKPTVILPVCGSDAWMMVRPSNHEAYVLALFPSRQANICEIGQAVGHRKPAPVLSSEGGAS